MRGAKFAGNRLWPPRNGSGVRSSLPGERRTRRYAPAQMSKLGVMGGTFDPIHYGHLLTAEEALQQFALDAVIFVPTGQPWMKEHEAVSPPEDRYLMTVIATANNPRFRVSRMEVDRHGPTYAVDTLRGLKSELGDDVSAYQYLAQLS